MFVLAGLPLSGIGPAGAQTTFVFANQGEPVSLPDPAIITDGISNRITRQIDHMPMTHKGATTEVIPGVGGEVGGEQGRDRLDLYPAERGEVP